MGWVGLAWLGWGPLKQLGFHGVPAVALGCKLVLVRVVATELPATSNMICILLGWARIYDFLRHGDMVVKESVA